MKKIVIRANAKINLSLIITGVMQDGYHDLDTIMCPIELYDTITVTRRQDNIITCRGIDISDDENIAVRAARLLMSEFKTTGVDIEIDKRIPISGGLGGSSADAAGVMFAFSHLFYIDFDKIKFLARQLGSDLPFLLQVATGAMRARGRGDILTEEELMPIDIVLAKPLNGVDTKEAYRIYDTLKKQGSKGDNVALINAIRNGDDICEYLINDLYKPACMLNSKIAPLFKLMKESNNSCAIMSGSGSSVIAICSDSEKALEIFNKIPDKYYKVITKTCMTGVKIVEEIVPIN